MEKIKSCKKGKNKSRGILLCFKLRIKSADGIKLFRKAALLVGCVVLVDEPLSSGFVNTFDGNFIGALGLCAAAAGDGCVKLLQNGLELGLVSLVARIADLTDKDALLRGLDVGH